MNSLLDDNDEDIEDKHRSHAGRRQDREITLGTTMVLGIFFALAVFGAVMFGFGYSIGGKHAASTITTAQSDPNATFNSFSKPSSGHATDLTKAPVPASVTVPLTAPPPALPKPPGPTLSPRPFPSTPTSRSGPLHWQPEPWLRSPGHPLPSRRPPASSWCRSRPFPTRKMPTC